MKRSFMVEFELPEILTDEFMSLIPDQRYLINKMMAEGTLKSYSLALDRSRAWAILDAGSEFDVMELLAQMPLIDFMVPYVSELMFHNSPEDVLNQFSLN